MARRVSVPYCIAIAAVDGKLTQAQFASARIADPLLRLVLASTEIIADAELNKLYPERVSGARDHHPQQRENRSSKPCCFPRVTRRIR